MRKIHRWLSVVFALLLLWIAATGLLSHAAAWVRDAEPQSAVTAPAGFVCPDNMTCRVKPDPDSAAAWTSYLHHLHNGEEFGVVGTVLSILSGFALLFFAFSGLWMYIQMYLRRSHRHSHPKRLFW